MEINFSEIKNLAIKKIYGTPSARVEVVTFDSRRVVANTAFICIKGENHDGHSFSEKALAEGATVIIGNDKACLEKLFRRYKNKTFLLVEYPKIASARLSALVYGASNKKMKTIAVTGTNGKTTVTAYVRSLLNLLGMPAGSVGTLGIKSSTGKIEFKKSTPTTPEAPDLHHIFRHLYTSGDEAVAMEVSSIAIEEKRVEGIIFDIGIHTNLSPEHLEYHKDFISYKRAKLKLFDQVKAVVVNIDDEEMAGDILGNFSGPVLTYSLDSNSKADLIADNIETSQEGSKLRITVKGENFHVTTPVIGRYNLANLLAAVGAALHLGFKMDKVAEALSGIETPEGRFELVQIDTGRTIILDYAHTPVALNNLLTEVRKIPGKRLIVLIAGIGIRDFGKMPKMAAITENRADEIVVSVDHPGFHPPGNIVNQVMKGFANPSSSNIHPTFSREEGVVTALSLSREGDIVLLTSGCINGCQIVKGEYIPHSDEGIIKEYFNQPPLQVKKKASYSD